MIRHGMRPNDLMDRMPLKTPGYYSPVNGKQTPLKYQELCPKHCDMNEPKKKLSEK